MGNKVYIRKESKSKFLSIPEIILLLGFTLMAFVGQSFGLYRKLGLLIICVVLFYCITKILMVFFYDIKFLNDTYDYIVFDSIKFLVIFIALMVSLKNMYDYISAEVDSKNVSVSSTNYSDTYFTYNSTIKVFNEEKDNFDTYYFESPLLYLDYFVGDKFSGKVFKINYKVLNDKNVIIDLK